MVLKLFHVPKKPTLVCIVYDPLWQILINHMNEWLFLNYIDQACNEI